MEKVKVGIIGCGMISEIYLKNMTTVFNDILEPIACTDINKEAAKKRAAMYGLKVLESAEELVGLKEIDLVLNLTIPEVHYEIAKLALMNGKHTYSEKPLATTIEEGEELVSLAKQKGLYIGAAPDTFLGGGLQTCRKLLEEGAIGKPISARGTMLARGPESFHPHPEFFYKEGAGPLLDMGPYYITALVSMFGSAKRVAGISKMTTPERIITGKERNGENFPCFVDTYSEGLIEFENEVIANITTSWDMSFPYWKSGAPLLEIFGSEGSMILPDPNTFCGITSEPMSDVGHYVMVKRGVEEFKKVPVIEKYIENSRGLGVADMALKIKNGGVSKVNGEMSLHVLEIMLGILESSKTGAFHIMKNKCIKPEILD